MTKRELAKQNPMAFIKEYNVWLQPFTNGDGTIEWMGCYVIPGCITAGRYTVRKDPITTLRALSRIRRK